MHKAKPTIFHEIILLGFLTSFNHYVDKSSSFRILKSHVFLVLNPEMSPLTWDLCSTFPIFFFKLLRKNKTLIPNRHRVQSYTSNTHHPGI